MLRRLGFVYSVVVASLIMLVITSCATLNLENYVAPKEGVYLSTILISEEPTIRYDFSSGFVPMLIVFGLPLTLVVIYGDVKRNKKTARSLIKTIIPINEGLKDFNYRNKLQEKYFETVEKFNWLKVKDIVSEESVEKYFSEVGSHHIIIQSNIEFTLEMDSLELTTHIFIKKVDRISLRNRQRIPKFIQIYKNRYKYISPMTPPPVKSETDKKSLTKKLNLWYENEKSLIEGQSKGVWRARRIGKLDLERSTRLKLVNEPYTIEEKREIMSLYWSDNNSKRVKDYLNKALIETQKMLIHDLSVKEKLPLRNHRSSLAKYAKSVWTIDEGAKRRIVESRTHILCSIPKGVSTERCWNRY